jgi:6,7-dimethyl-8-ribityllumazine synthase
MAEQIVGNFNAKDHAFGLVVARFNEFITRRLLDGALDALVRHGADPARITQVWVPGCWELPVTAKRLAQTRRFAALIALGCVVRGATPHFEYVAGQCTNGLARAALETGAPIALGVLTTDTLEQAIERAGAKAGNKGAQAAISAIEMANVMAALPRPGEA